MSNPNTTDTSGPGRGRQRITKRGLFIKDLPSMMYSFGESEPQKDVLNLMEDMVVDHITDVLTSAHKISTNRGKLRIEDIMFALRASATKTSVAKQSLDVKYTPYPLARRKLTLAEKQLSRIEELLFMQEDLKRARGSAADLAGFGTEEAAGHGNHAGARGT